MKSYKILAEGGLELWDNLKANSQGIVRVTTNDTEFPLAHVLRNNRQELRLGIYGPTRPGDKDTHETGRRYRSQVVSIPRKAVREVIAMN